MQDVIHGYQLLGKVGSGAKSIVYRARHVRSGELVAIKRVVHTGEGTDKPLRHMVNEYRNGRALLKMAEADGRSLPHLVEIRSMFVERRLLRLRARCLVMSLVPGRTLDEFADYSIGRLIDIFIQTCTGLQFMHAHGFVHADVKPNNIVVDPNGQATLVDLGFSCESGTRSHSVKGTFDYIAPEQIKGGIIDQRTDVYNLGATMYKVFTGQALPSMSAGDGANSFVAGHAIKATPPHQINPQVPQLLSALISECIRRKPAKRPQSIFDVLRRLKEEAIILAHKRESAIPAG